MAGRRKHMGRGAKRKRSPRNREELTQKQKKHLKEFGEAHPSEERDTVRRYTKVIDAAENEETGYGSSDDSDPEVTAYHQLVASLAQQKSADRDHTASTEFSDESDESEDRSVDGADDEGGGDDITSQNSAQEKSANTPGIGNPEIFDESSEENQSEADDLIQDEELGAVEDHGETVDLCLKESDPFTKHFEVELEEQFVEELSSNRNWKNESIKIPHIGKAMCHWLSDEHKQTVDKTEKDLKRLHVKHKLCELVGNSNKRLCGSALPPGEILTRCQLELFKILNTYQDLCYPDRTPQNGEEVRLVYCLHALNHILKTRSRVMAHNAKIKTKSSSDPSLLDYRDQGLTRPKVLMVLPFRDSALRVVNILTDLLMAKDQTFVSNKKRFLSEYGENNESAKKGLKPEDYEATFSGNIDDHFRIGLGVAKKTLKLYTDFYNSDIILASPLGLRTMIGGDGEKTDSDFLSSIELLIFDQADVFLMQNWDHILYLMDHLHLQPKEAHGVDFSRVRMWTLSGWAKYYRQTVVLSSLVCPEINSLFNKTCHNYSGKVAVCKQNEAGAICQIIVQLPQVFQRLQCTSFKDLPDARFEFFIKKVLPHHKDPVMSQTLIFIPSYFDYVRIRNYFVKEEVNFVSICEYSSNKVISKSRNMFFHGKSHFLLYTERIHFFRRFKLRGIKHLLFYGLPLYALFYSEMCNVMRDPGSGVDHENLSCTTLYSRYDAQRLAAVVGADRAAHMINTDKAVHMFVTGENG